MMTKLRFYIILTCCSALLLFVFYKMLNNDEITMYEKSTFPHEPSTPYQKQRLHPMKNVNELLSITQPSQHLQNQRLREAEVHAKIREQALKQQFSKLGFVRNMSKNYLLNMHPNVHHRIVHLDLKGAPPSVSYLLKLFPLLKQLQATGILIEYEDMFPFYGNLDTFQAFNAYSRFEIQQILDGAKKNNLEVIPLVQTFGHFEFVLKQLRYSHMREVPEYPQVVCPSQNATHEILRKMIDQIVELHPELKWIHIGADEVYYIGQCSLCQARMEKEQLGTEALFLDHVLRIARYVKEKHNVQPIMWDDMFRKIPLKTMQESHVGKYVEVMIWWYKPVIDETITPEVWDKYSKIFPSVWVASAFKGATGSDQQMPNIEYHLDNQYSWMKLIAKYQTIISFRGMILTGWQRYDHFAVLCELLPAAVPSLAVSLIYIRKGNIDSKMLDQTSKHLGCLKPLNLTSDYWKETQCTFPGVKVFYGIQRYMQLKEGLKKLQRNHHLRGWFSDYQVKMKFSSPAHIEIGIRDIKSLKVNATLLHTYMQNIMPDIFDKYTVQEWLETYMDPIIHEIKTIHRKADELLAISSWPRRPLVMDNSDQKKKNTMKELLAGNRSNDL